MIKPWTPPERSLDGQRIDKILAIKIFPLDSDLIVWDTDGNLVRFSTEQDRVTWTYKPKAKLIDVDVDGNSVATLEVSGQVTALDVVDGKPKRAIKIEKPTDEFHSPMAVQLTPDGTQIALTDRDNHLRIWNIESGIEQADVALKDVWRSSVNDVDAEGRVYCTGESGDVSFIFNSSTKSLRTISGYTQIKRLGGGSIVAVEGGNHLVLENPNGAEEWDARLQTAIWSYKVNEEETLATISMPGGMPWLGGRTALVNLRDGKVLRELDHPDAPMPSLEWVQNLKIVGGHKGLVLVYDQASEPLAVLRGPEVDIRQLLVSNSFLYAVDEAGYCHRWKLSDILNVAS